MQVDETGIILRKQGKVGMRPKVRSKGCVKVEGELERQESFGKVALDQNWSQQRMTESICSGPECPDEV